ncbi:MAG: hypothetical protein IPK80_18350 [Nannocystis sp.]|nr:hypothetical protein [Nannocystis sp.]
MSTRRAPKKMTIRGLGLAALAAMMVASITACGAPCERLSSYVCDGGDADYCARAAGFVDEQLVGVGGVKLTGELREETCSIILGNVELSNAYRHKAKEKLLGVPYFEVAKNRKPEGDESKGDNKGEGKTK